MKCDMCGERQAAEIKWRVQGYLVSAQFFKHLKHQQTRTEWTEGMDLCLPCLHGVARQLVLEIEDLRCNEEERGFK